MNIQKPAYSRIKSNFQGAIPEAWNSGESSGNEYDARRRMSMKKLPGAQPVYLVYDNRDRLVLTQDGNLRDDNEWMFTKYDVLNRHVLTGIYSHSATIDQDSMQIIVNESMETFFENEREGYNLVDSCFGYTNNSFPELDSDDEILTVTYYDGYDFDVNPVDTYDNVRAYAESFDDTDYPKSEINYAVKGLVTGSLVKVLNEDKYLFTVSFYDDKYRVIRTYAENYLGGDDLFLTRYDFIGNVLKTKQIHYKDADATTPTVINQRFIYDHAFRLKEVYHQVGTNPEVLMAAMEYNELGQLVKKNLNENADDSFLQEIDYEYNIRGWKTKINDPDNLGNDKFAMELHYTDVLPTVNSTGDEQYNGNIAAIKWNTPEFGVKAYGYGYDNINRLERARFAAGAALNVDVNKYTVENITYDANGNILTLGRHNTAAGFIDNLAMDYDGNQLKKTFDSGDLALGFVDGVDAETEYHYDLNGNMDIDDNKGIVFAYNYLNLPKEIVGGNDTVRYIYDAAGTKISKELAQGGAISYTDYIGNFVYKDGDLDYILTDEGRITEPTAGIFQYEYFLTDHLGSVRTVFADGNGDGVLADSEVLQETHYYPFGMTIGNLAVDRGADNKIKYNGMELQDDMLGGVKLNLLDYGARYYMPDVPVFTTIDPLAEKFSSWSPYNYCFNNPVRFTDPDGMNPEDEIINKVLKSQNIEQGYNVSHNNETGVTTITHTSAQWHPDKTSPIGEGTANLQVATTTYTIGSDGELSEASVSTTGLEASISEEGGAWGSTNYNVDKVTATNEGYEFANASYNSDKLADLAKDPIVSGVSAIKQNSNPITGDALFNQDLGLPGLVWHDAVQSMAPSLVKAAGESFGVEDAINFDRDNHTWLKIPQERTAKAAKKLRVLSRQTPVIEL